MKPTQPLTGGLLDLLAEQNRRLPLAEALRPKTLQDFLGQDEVLAPGKPLRNLIENGELTSLLLWGPPGVGKTTLARLIAQHADAHFSELSAVQSGVADLRTVVTQARDNLTLSGKPTVLFIDEIHRYSKAQQDALLPHVENGAIVLIGATTENPSFQVIAPLMSRVLLVRFGFLTRNQVQTLVQRGVAYLSAQGQAFQLDPQAENFLLNYANGDGRSALNLLELASRCAPSAEPSPLGKGQGEGKKQIISVELLEQLAQQARLNYDRDGDGHYDHASAYQKSMRGSDPNASVYWLGAMIAAGEDPRFIARRLVVTASEDVGMADPMALVLAMNAMHAVEKLGLPEARIPLAQATLYVANAPKNNHAICAIDAVLSDIEKAGHFYPVPAHLRDAHYSDAKGKYGHGVGYIYSHDNPEAEQSFLPMELLGKRYVPD